MLHLRQHVLLNTIVSVQRVDNIHVKILRCAQDDSGNKTQDDSCAVSVRDPHVASLLRMTVWRCRKTADGQDDMLFDMLKLSC